MKKAAKGWLIAAASLVLVGCVLFAGTMAALGWDFSKLSTVGYETHAYEIDEPFGDISLKTETADIVFARSDDGTCRVECREEETGRHSVSVKENTLVIEHIDTGAWYSRIGLRFGTPKITVYLPETEYGALSVCGSTGNVEIPKGFSFKSVDISLNTGNVTVSGVRCEGGITANVTTGNVGLTGVTCGSFLSDGSTGDIVFDRVVAAGKISVERSTGNVTFVLSDAAEIFVKTGTGNVAGSLLSDKVFITQTGTGHVDVPKTVTGGRCEIETAAGNIEITVG